MKQKPKVVLDTNVLISGLWRGVPGDVLEEWKRGKFILLISSPILNEYLTVLSRFIKDPKLIAEWAALLTAKGRSEWVNPKKTLLVISEDPSDNRFLECAVEGKADVIVSGDKHLLDLKFYKDIPILTPRQYLTH